MVLRYAPCLRCHYLVASTPSINALNSTALTWPTLTVQWFPDVKEPEGKDCRIHRVLIGTHTSDEKPNHVQIAEVEVPKTSRPNVRDYDEDRGEIGGYGKASSSADIAAMKWKVVQRIDHPGEVNKARYCPQNPDLIATLAIDGSILIFDRTKHSSEPNGVVNPQIKLLGLWYVVTSLVSAELGMPYTNYDLQGSQVTPKRQQHVESLPSLHASFQHR
jgi:hypothetical protein